MGNPRNGSGSLPVRTGWNCLGTHLEPWIFQNLDSDIYDYGFIFNSTVLHEAAMSVLVTTIYGRWRGTTTTHESCFNACG